MDSNTPLIQQYLDIKKQYNDTLLLFQVGDFYELFFDDAKTAANCLGITLTARGKSKGEPIPLCGVPISTVDHYMAKLIKAGFNVAICNQLEEAKPGTVVKRGVSQVLTPGTLIDGKLLHEKSPSYLLAVAPLQDQWGLIFGEVITGQLSATIISAGAERVIESELSRYFPDEIILPKTRQGQDAALLFKRFGYVPTFFGNNDISCDDQQEIAQWVSNQFNQESKTLLSSKKEILTALSYFYCYIRRNQHAALSLFQSIEWYNGADFLQLDSATQRNLELVKNSVDGTIKNSLFSVLDHAQTGMGSRLLKKWLLRPLMQKNAINQRLDVVEQFFIRIDLRYQLADLLRKIGDAERIIGRVIMDRGTHQDFLSLITILGLMPTIKKVIMPVVELPLLQVIDAHIAHFNSIHALLLSALEDDHHTGYIIKRGFNRQLDYLRDLVENSHRKIAELERTEQQRTGINSLKIRYTGIYGYLIEITKIHGASVPDEYERVQTLVGKERYTIPLLNQMQRDIQLAQTETKHIEQDIFGSIKKELFVYKSDLRRLCYALAHLDLLIGLSQAAHHHGYTRPILREDTQLYIYDGRNPIVELVSQGQFISNDTELTDDQTTWLITGPNMGGKSTYLRQVALNCIMAHIGSFVAARSAEVPMLDRIFTRIGAGDNLADGKSTFLVEMEETAAICTQSTSRSLVILDEVGRGTSTFDGLAIAQAVVEYITTNIKARCLFATHYHELVKLADTMPGIVCYYAASKQVAGGILFLYKMVRGVADGSFGIEVAKLAHLPSEVIDRAHDLATDFMQECSQKQLKGAKIASFIDSINIDDLSAERALELIKQLKSYGKI